MKLRIAGLDIGNFGLKAAFGESEEDQFVIPTIVDFARKKSTTMTEEQKPENLLDNFKISISSPAIGSQYNNVSLIVGKGAAGGREMPVGSRKHQEDLPIIVALAALAYDAYRRSKSKKIIQATYAPVLGIPLSYFSLDVRDQLEQRLIGTHSVRIETIGFEAKIALIIPTDGVVPEDAIYSYDIQRDWDGNVVNSEIENKDLLIIGIGQLTTDVAYVNRMKFDDYKSFDIEFGAAYTKDRFIDDADNAFKRRTPPTSFRISDRAKLDEIIKNDFIIDELGESIKDSYERYVKDDALNIGDKIISTIARKRLTPHHYYGIGGALNIYKNDLVNRMKDQGIVLEIPKRPEMATARGLYKWGASERSGFRDFEVAPESEVAATNETNK